MRRREVLGGAAALVLAVLCAWLLLPAASAPDAPTEARLAAGEAAPPPPAAGLAPAPEETAPTPEPGASAKPPEAPRSVPPPRVEARAEDEPELPKERVPLDVTVVDPRGDPVPGARIVAVWGEWRTAVVAADVEGKATLRVPRGTRALEVVGVEPADPRPFLFVHYHALLGGESSTRVAVRVGSGIDGRLVGPDGAPIGGGLVRTVPEIYGFSAVRTDADGKFHLGALEGRRVDVRFDGMVAEPAADVELVHNEEWKIRVSFPRESAAALVGDLRALASAVLPGPDPILLRAERVARRADLSVVVLDVDGRPIEGARVHTVSSGVDAHDRTGVATDAAGRAVLRGLPDWPVRLEVNAPLPRDLGTFQVVFVTQRLARIDDADPGGPPITVRCPRIATLRGRVVDAAGNAVAKAWCAALEGSQYVACFPTDAEGRFDSISNVPVGTRLQVSARYPMNKPTSCGVVDGVIAGDGELRIVLEPIPGR